MPTMVTDPAILAQLNGGGPQPVTDPSILAQLNGSAPPQQQPGVLQQIGHSIGLAGRNLVQGALSLPASIADVPAFAYNTAANMVEGKDKGYRVPEQNQALAKVLTRMGVPEPQNTTENVVGGIEQGIGGAGSGLGIGNALSSAAEPVTAAVGQALTASPGRALASGGMAGGASSGAAAAGAPPWVQAGAGLAAGALPFVNPASLVRGGDLTPNEQQAMDAGYKLPPATMQNPSILSKVLGGFSGKIKSQQAASSANKGTTNSLAHAELGLPDDTVLSNNVFNNVRDTAGNAYQAVRDFAPRITTDGDFKTDVANASNLNGDLAKDFPELVANDKISQLATAMAKKGDFSASAGIDAVKTLRNAATKNLQADDPQANDLGMVQRNLATAIDDLMARNMSAAGSPDVVQNYQAARQLIAKSYDVQAATNPSTGDVSPTKLAQIAARRPLSGNLQTIADMGNAFPKAVQSPSKFGGTEPLSVLDILGALGSTTTGFAAGHPAEGLGAAATILSRPAARALIMSDPYQKALANGGTISSAGYLPSNVQPLLGALNQYGVNK